MTIGSTLARPHVWQPSANPAASRTLLLLHGMAADEHDLLALGRLLDPSANLLSPRGLVNTDGANRFFLRFADGSFDEPGIAQAADELAEFVAAVAAEYGFDAANVWAAGFSNGANTAVALLQRHPATLVGVAAYSVTKALSQDVFLGASEDSLAGKEVFIANGHLDTHAPILVARELAAQLDQLGAHVQLLEHTGGHTIVMEHVRPVIARLATN